MTIQTSCPACQREYRLSDSLLNKKARCKECNAKFRVRSGASELIERGKVVSAAGSNAAVAADSSLASPATWPGEATVPVIWHKGDVILDQYDVLELLGAGGMGQVYKVHSRALDLDLAVKSPLPEILSKPGAVENFERECETWVDLGLHPHIVSCYYVQRLGGIPRVFAEYVAGGSLDDWISDKRLYEGSPQQALKRILDFAIQFAWGLHYAHERGLVHQDVKPANVLVTPDGTVKVTDFGLAKAREVAGLDQPTLTRNSVLVSGVGGTFQYMAPEQAEARTQAEAGVSRDQRRKFTRRIDVWGWAVSILDLFVGETYRGYGPGAREQLDEYLQGNHPTQISPMPAGVAELLRECFRDEPSDRPATLQVVTARLRELYAEIIGSAYPREEPQAVELQADSLNNRAVSLWMLGKREAAESAWEQALQAEPHHPESTFNLGLQQWRSGRIDDVALLRKVDEVATLHPGQWLPQYYLAQIHVERGDCETAIEILKSLPTTEAKQPRVKLLLALATDHLASSRRCLRTLEGHGNVVHSVCLSVDGRYALSGSSDETLKLWDVSTGRCLRTFEGHTSGVESACLSADNRYALSGSWDKTLKLWDVSTGRCLRTFEGHTAELTSVCLSVDGRYALSGSTDKTLKLWEVSTGSCLRTFEGHADRVNSACLSVDGRYALSGSDDETLKQWDVSTGRCLRTIKGHTKPVTSVCLSVDGRVALSGVGVVGSALWADSYTPQLWDIFTGHCLHTLDGHARPIESVCLSADDRYALSGSRDKALKLWETATGRCLRTLEGHAHIVTSLCLSVNCCYALSGSFDKTLKLWKLSWLTLTIPFAICRIVTTEAARTAELENYSLLRCARQAAHHGDYDLTLNLLRRLRTKPHYNRTHATLDLWSTLYTRFARCELKGAWQRSRFEGHTGSVTSVCLSVDCRYALSGSVDKSVKLWDVSTGRCVRTFDGHTDDVSFVCLSGDGTLALSGSYDETVKLWDVSTGRCLRSLEGLWSGDFFDIGHIYVNSMSLSGDGRYALGSCGESLKLWDVSTGRCLRTFARDIHSVCQSRDGRYALSGNLDSTLKLWEVATRRCIRTFKGHSKWIESVCLSVDGRFALSGSRDQTLKLWDVSTGRCLRTFEGHSEYVTSVCLSVDGRFALSGSDDKTLKTWDVCTGRCLLTLDGHTEPVNSVCLSVDGRLALSGSGDTTLMLWFLDWELEARQPADWDEGARPLLDMFLTGHIPYAATLPADGTPSDEEVTRALTRQGPPTWTESDFKQFLYTLGCAGYGWLRPEGVRCKLQELAASWTGPPHLHSEERSP